MESIASLYEIPLSLVNFIFESKINEGDAKLTSS